MSRLSAFINWGNSHRGNMLDCIRIYLGLGLFARGLLLITNTSTEYFVQLVQNAGQSWLTTAGLLHYVMLAHFVGGAMLTIGFMTRIAALVQIPILAVAVFVVHRREGLFALGQSLEFSALVLFLLLVFLVVGSSRWSLDQAVFGSRKSESTHPDAAPQH